MRPRSTGASCAAGSRAGARAIPSILSALEAQGIAVEAVTTHRPSLDDVYLHYTGRDFRADDEQAPGETDSGDGRL